MAPPTTLEQYLVDHPGSAALLRALRRILAQVGPVDEQLTKSQLAFRRTRIVAWAWAPGQYRQGRGAPLVLSFDFSSRDRSPRWKEVVKIRPGRFMHHLELWSAEDLDDEVTAWLRLAWEAAAGEAEGTVGAP
jgi:hypothetical protein